MDILDELNPEQKKAVQHVDGPLLILAGAGSGKTRVITYRIAYLVENAGVSPFNILAVTFTNKAANEMKERVEDLVGISGRLLWIATFHSTCARILRKYIDRLGYSKSYTIYDADDQANLIKEIIKDISIRYSQKQIINMLSRAKENLINPEEYANQASDHDERLVAQIYREYQRYLRENNALDFDDLIMLTIQLFEENPDVLEFYQRKFQYVLVDEYQDTNYSQYILVKMLAEKHKNVCVVGDDDQSIYSWRGADINNILDFEKDYKSVKTFRLEQNYRSTKRILEAANNIIKNNKYRKNKKLWCSNDMGKNLLLYEAEDEKDEARYVVQKIRKFVEEKDANYSDFAIFYRVNAQSRNFEDYLRDSGIPYNVVGGFKYYQRAEVKDVLAYLRVLVNPDDGLSLKRIINRPTRGIGSTTLGRLEDYSQMKGISLFDAVKNVDDIPSIGTAANRSVKKFAAIFDKIVLSESPSEIIKQLLDKSKYIKSLEDKGTIEDQTRAENARGLIAVAREFERQNESTNLEEFLESVSLLSDIDELDEETEQVNLMTLHSAKGLEFPIIFITGMEMGLFPHKFSMDDPIKFEEERRLCYVGITRAKQKVYMTHTRKREIFGFTTWNEKSVFIDEIPRTLIDTSDDEFIDKSGAKDLLYEEYEEEQSIDFDYKPDDLVRHAKFGPGKIVEVSGSGENSRVRVNFFSGKDRTMMAMYANLEKT